MAQPGFQRKKKDASGRQDPGHARKQFLSRANYSSSDTEEIPASPRDRFTLPALFVCLYGPVSGGARALAGPEYAAPVV